MAAKFILTKSAKAYFDKLNKASATGSLKHDLEEWWLCAQAGLVANTLGGDPEPGSKDTVEYFIKSLEPAQARIRGLLLMRHLERVDAGGMKRELLESEMGKLLAASDTKLTDHGVKLLNRYASAGFELIRDEIGSQSDLYVFMLEYDSLIKRLSAGGVEDTTAAD